MAHVRDRRQPGAELAAVVDETRQRDAAEIDAVVRALARHEDVAAALAARLVIRERDLHRRVDGLRSGVRKEDAIQVARRELGHARGELELLRMRAQEWRTEVELAQLPADGIRDLLATVPGGYAEQTAGSIDDLVAAIVPQPHALGANDHLGIGLELAVRRERHPVLVERKSARRALVLDREFGVAHVWSPRDARMPRAQVPGRRYARINPASYTFASRPAAVRLRSTCESACGNLCCAFQ